MNINDPILPERPRQLLNELCTSIAGVAKSFHDLAAYGYTMDNIQDMLLESIQRMDVPDEHKDAVLKAYDAFLQREHGHGHEVDIAHGTRQAVASMLGDRKSVVCAVMFRSGASLQGELSETEWGGLKMTTAGAQTVEQFFDYEDVCVVAREVSAGASEPTLIVRS
jgi:hypothetical protein